MVKDGIILEYECDILLLKAINLALLKTGIRWNFLTFSARAYHISSIFCIIGSDREGDAFNG